MAKVVKCITNKSESGEISTQNGKSGEISTQNAENGGIIALGHRLNRFKCDL